MPDSTNALVTPGAKAEQLYERIKADLVAGRLTPGQRLSEASLSRQYGVSRSPIREATIRLETEGLMERRGMVVRVRERSPEEIVDIYRARVFLEGALAADAATRHRDLDLLRLEQAVIAEAGIDPADSAATVRANRAVHDALAAAAHNATLADLQQRLTAQVTHLPATTLSFPGRWAHAHDEHRRLLAAIRDRDAETAQRIAEGHLARARDLRLRLFTTESAPAVTALAAPRSTEAAPRSTEAAPRPVEGDA